MSAYPVEPELDWPINTYKAAMITDAIEAPVGE